MSRKGSLIDKIWFNKGIEYKLAWPLLKPLSLLFSYIIRQRRKKYETGRKDVYRAPIPVVIVGNITVGGNGKTPVVIWLVESLMQLGFRVGVVSRGYGGKAPNYPYLVEDDSPSRFSGDEPLLIRQRTHALVAVSPKRSDAVKLLVDKGVDFIIADDGLQHYALARDLEITVIDGERRYGNEELLPLGPLREPLSRLDKVAFRICNGGMAQANEIAMSIAPGDLVNIKTDEKKKADALNECVAIAGIGAPQRFFNTLLSLNTDLKESYSLEDHQQLTLDELLDYAGRGKHLLMTEKDAVKCRALVQKSDLKSALDHLWYLPISAVFAGDEAQNIINKLVQIKGKYGL